MYKRGESRIKWQAPSAKSADGACFFAADRFLLGRIPCLSAFVGLCKVFPVGVGNRYLIPSRPLFGPILRQFEGSAFYRSAENKRGFHSTQWEDRPMQKLRHINKEKDFGNRPRKRRNFEDL